MAMCNKPFGHASACTDHIDDSRGVAWYILGAIGPAGSIYEFIFSMTDEAAYTSVFKFELKKVVVELGVVVMGSG